MFVVKFYDRANNFLGLAPFYFKNWVAAQRHGNSTIAGNAWYFEVMSLTEGY